MSALHREAQQLMDYLALPNAIALKGAVWCESERLLLLLSLKSITRAEADERLTKQIANIKKELGAQS